MPLEELFLVLLGLFVLATPIITVYLLVKFRALRSEFKQFSEATAEKESAFRREFSELKRQIASAPIPVQSTEQRSPTSETKEVIPLPKPVSPLASPKPTIPAQRK